MSRAALLADRRDLVHWAIQAAYAHIRAGHPNAYRIYVDVSERPVVPAMIEAIVTFEGEELYRRADHGVDAEPGPVDDLLDAVLANCQPHQVPAGWRLMDVDRGLFEVRLTAVPAAVQVDLGERDELGYYPAPTGLPGVVAAALDLLLSALRPRRPGVRPWPGRGPLPPGVRRHLRRMAQRAEGPGPPGSGHRRADRRRRRRR
jgi:hypothetical protein